MAGSDLRRPRRRVDGVLLLDKPVGMSSNAALQAVRRLFGAAKAGHTGTLDPLAGGLLPVCLGEATKFSQTLLDADKAYEATLLLGVTTATGDAEGEVLERRPVAVTRILAERALAGLRGEIDQVPPMYSALKRDGTPLYRLARQGIEVERAPRRVTIHRLDLLGFAAPQLSIRVDCSKGTYVRTLAEEIGAALGCGAHLEGLRRVRIGALRVDQAITLRQLEAIDPARRDELLLGVDALVADLARLDLDASTAQRFRLGQAVAAPLPDGQGPWRTYGDGHFLGLGVRVGDRLAPKRLLATAAEPAGVREA